jgi:hypothetical protein
MGNVKRKYYFFIAPSVGIEPTVYGLEVRCIIRYATRAKELILLRQSSRAYFQLCHDLATKFLQRGVRAARRPGECARLHFQFL